MQMKKIYFIYPAIIAAGMAMSSCSGNSGTNSNATKTDSIPAPELCGMKCEFVPTNSNAIIYGKNLTGAKAIFNGGDTASAENGSNDSVLIVKVPANAKAGAIEITNGSKSTISKFLFRDNRNHIIDFDSKLASWGGYFPFDEKGQKITSTLEIGKLPAALPDTISGNYGFLFGNYIEDWTMTFPTYLQYCADPNDGGRGNVSVAGEYKDLGLQNLALKFEVFIPAEAAYVGPKTEIFFGPINAENKHGREESAIYFWKPFEKAPYSTDGWITVTVPFTEFTHGTTSDDIASKFKLDVEKSTNLSFVVFGRVVNKEKPIFMCVDNLRVVPIN